MRNITVTIQCIDNGHSFDVLTQVDGLPTEPSTIEVVGIIEMAKRQYIASKEHPTPDAACVTLPNGDCVAPGPCMHTPPLPEPPEGWAVHDKAAIMHSMCVDPCGPDCTTPTHTRAPDGAPWYAHLDGPCGPECDPPKLAECGQPYPCGHAPDGGNHPKAKT